MENSSKAIGVIDTGLGGLCAVKELRRLLPAEDIIYFGDTGRVPYGNRSDESIIRYSRQDMRFLTSRNIKIVVIACGTISSVAIEDLRNEFPDRTIIGVVEGACEKAVSSAYASGKKRILVLATQATVAKDIYRRTINSAAPDIEVINRACPLFVPLVENGYTDANFPPQGLKSGAKITELVAREYISEFVSMDIGAVLLGCTHYPMIKNTIASILPDSAIVDSGAEAAEMCRRELARSGNLNVKGQGDLSIFVSDEIHNFEPIAKKFLETEKELCGSDEKLKIMKINIDEY